MRLLEEKILTQGRVLPGNILKVDGFLNQQIDIDLLCAVAKEFAALFKGTRVTKILTVEASGIAIASITAQCFGNVPVVFGKKHKTLNRDESVYSTPIFSFTHHTSYDVTVAKRLLTPEDHILIIDDFLADGGAVRGMMDLIAQAGATLAGVGIVIEKGFQGGGDKLRAEGVPVKSLAIIDDMNNGEIRFRPGN